MNKYEDGSAATRAQIDDIDLCSQLAINSENPGSLVCKTSADLPEEYLVGQTITFATGPETKINIEAVCHDLTVNILTENGCLNALNGLEDPGGTGSLTIFQDGTVSFKSITPFMGDEENVQLTTLQNELVENSTTIPTNLDKQYGLPAVGIMLIALAYYGIRTVAKEKNRIKTRTRRIDEIEGLRRETEKNLPLQMAEEQLNEEKIMNLLLGRPKVTGTPLESLGHRPTPKAKPKEYGISKETLIAIETVKQQRREKERLVDK